MEIKTFDIMKKGYNRIQVDDYIREQKTILDDTIKQLNHALNQIEILNQEKQRIQNAYEEMKDNLEAKEKYATQMARIAIKEANMIVDSANQNADMIIQEALTMAREVLVEISRISKEAKNLKSSMKDEIEELSNIIEKFEVPNIPSINLLNEEE